MGAPLEAGAFTPAPASPRQARRPWPRSRRATTRHRVRRTHPPAGDQRLVERIRRGDDGAFEQLYGRYGPGLLAFCRQMVGSREDAEDVLQQTLIKAHRGLLATADDIVLRPWLYAIARNEAISALRRRNVASEPLDGDPAVAEGDVATHVQQREELRAMLADLRRLPHEQRAALLLASLGTLSGDEIAQVLECDREKVKSLVFRARRSLATSREARDASCAEVRRQLALLRGGSLRRKLLREHLLECEGCRAFRLEVRRQRQLLAAILPIGPLPALHGLGLAGTAGGVGAGLAGGGSGASVAAWAGADGFGKLAVAIVAAAGVVGVGASGQAGLDPFAGRPGHGGTATTTADPPVHGTLGGTGAPSAISLRSTGPDSRPRRNAAGGEGSPRGSKARAERPRGGRARGRPGSTGNRVTTPPPAETLGSTETPASAGAAPPSQEVAGHPSGYHGWTPPGQAGNGAGQPAGFAGAGRAGNGSPGRRGLSPAARGAGPPAHAHATGSAGTTGRGAPPGHAKAGGMPPGHAKKGD